MSDPQWQALLRAMRLQNVPEIRRLSVALDITYVNDNSHNPTSKTLQEPPLACESCKWGKHIGEQGDYGWMCMLEKFQACRPEVPTARYKWEAKTPPLKPIDPAPNDIPLDPEA